MVEDASRMIQGLVSLICSSRGIDCDIEVMARPAVDDLPAGLDMIIKPSGISEIDEGVWTLLRESIESAVIDEGYVQLEWLSMTGRLDGRQFHGLAFIPAQE